MAYIKRLVMSGFKSFARRTEIVFDRGINVILGPNGSGKSNVSDALCFVLGRLSIKSMRAAKSANLLFMGSKYVKPAHEASVEIVFDNSDGAFSMDGAEITLQRVLRHNGQGVYRINGETKTRAEVIEILAHAGIDPYGFNLILQGQIQSIVKMHSEDRRKIIEEVAGISIYESRKEKSLHELEKTEEKLKEISAILRERSAYLRNLDRERSQALKFKELEENVKRSKASILSKKHEEKNKEVESIEKSIGEKSESRDKIKKKLEGMQQEVEAKSSEANEINKSIQRSSGLEQESLNTQIANLKAELEGLKVRKESYEHRKGEIERRISEMNKSLPNIELEIEELKKKSPLMAKKAQELKKKKDELAIIEEERKSALTLKSELNSLREMIKDKERQIARLNAQSESIVKNMEDYSVNLNYKNEDECAKAVLLFREALIGKREEIEELNKREIENEKMSSIADSEIKRLGKIKGDVNSIDVCPLCQSKITAEHIGHVNGDCDEKIKDFREKAEKAIQELIVLREQREKILFELKTLDGKIDSGEREIIKHKTLKERQEQLKKVVDEEKAIRAELANLDVKRKNLEGKTIDTSAIEDRYYAKIMEIEEISARTEENIDTSLLYKQRELESTINIVKRSAKDLEEINASIIEITEKTGMKSGDLVQREKQEAELNAKFKKLFEKRDALQKEIQEISMEISDVQNSVRQSDDQINYLRIGKAKLDAEKEALEMELTEFTGVELIQGSVKALEERLFKSQEALRQIGSINMRALEVYDEVKKEYDIVAEKVATLENEKIEIMKIIEEIDKKKTREFMKTFKAINTLFSENFSKLSSKGVAFLEIENKEDIFAGGVTIVVKLAKGKYFDVTSLSGGEQTLVALSLLFAIQEHKPYHFYIFDEIDAALDKRNSERLAALLTQYMKNGQYIVITHNDAIILNSNILYGVSMHEGVSKILSLKISDGKVEKPSQDVPPEETREHSAENSGQ